MLLLLISISRKELFCATKTDRTATFITFTFYFVTSLFISTPLFLLKTPKHHYLCNKSTTIMVTNSCTRMDEPQASRRKRSGSLRSYVLCRERSSSLRSYDRSNF